MPGDSSVSAADQAWNRRGSEQGKRGTHTRALEALASLPGAQGPHSTVLGPRSPADACLLHLPQVNERVLNRLHQVQRITSETCRSGGVPPCARASAHPCHLIRTISGLGLGSKLSPRPGAQVPPVNGVARV